MRIFYLETSSLLRVLFREKDYQKTLKLLETADSVVTSQLTLIEAQRALIRLKTDKILSEAKIRELSGILTVQSRSWTVMQITEAVLRRSGQDFPIEPVRTLDAIHLATAIEFSAIFPEIQVISCDNRVVENLEGLGLS